jgi:hypothetical protein
VIGPMAFTSVCGAAAFFMLEFLCALLREAKEVPYRFTNRLARGSGGHVSIEHRPQLGANGVISRTANSSVAFRGLMSKGALLLNSRRTRMGSGV